MPVSKKQTYPKKDFKHTEGYKKRHPKKPVEDRGRDFIPYDFYDINPMYLALKVMKGKLKK